MNASRFLVGKDGKTGYERRRGRKCKLHSVPIGEKVWYKKIRRNKVQENKLETEWFEGIWLGHNRNSNEILVGTSEGVVKAYAIRRQPEDVRWDGEMIKKMKGTPQKPDPNRPGDHVPISIRLEEAVQLKPEEEDIINKGVHLRRFRITIPMLNKYGYTEECEGCRFKQAGLNNSRAHSERCRRRLSEAVAKDEVDAVIIDRENERIAIRLDDKPEEAEDKEEEMGIDDSADNIGIEGGGQR